MYVKGLMVSKRLEKLFLKFNICTVQEPLLFSKKRNRFDKS